MRLIVLIIGFGLAFNTWADSEYSVHYLGIVQVWKAMGWAAVIIALLMVIWKQGWPWKPRDRKCQEELAMIKDELSDTRSKADNDRMTLVNDIKETQQQLRDAHERVLRMVDVYRVLRDEQGSS